MSDTRSIVSTPYDGRGGVVTRETTLISIASSITETDIFNRIISKNIMGIHRMLRLSLIGAKLNNSGAAEAACTFRVYVGGTLRFQDTLALIATSATWVPFNVEVWCAMQDASNTMILGGNLFFGVTAAPNTGIGDTTTDEQSGLAPFGSATGTTFTQDTTADWALRLTWANGTSNANVIFRRHYAIAEVL